MKILIAPDKFKGTLTAKEATLIIEKAAKKVFSTSQAILLPLADGGEGTVQTLVSTTKGKIIRKRVTGPSGQKVQAYFGLLGLSPLSIVHRPSTAVIEMAAASGLNLIPEERRSPLLTTTYGTGELIKAALDYGASEIIVGIGGSATTDGGMGMVQALGVKFLNAQGKEVGFGGKELKKLENIDISGLDRRLNKVKFLVASDVDNPLYGPQGAAYIYGPQKGATPAVVKELDEGLRNYARIIKRNLGKDIANIPGAGAAGGLGAGLIAFLKAEIKSGANLVMEKVGLEQKLTTANLVITGEGKIDAQTLRGKVPAGVAKLAKERNIPLFAIGGEVALTKFPKGSGFDRVFSLTQVAGSKEAALKRPFLFLRKTAEKAMEEFKTSLEELKKAQDFHGHLGPYLVIGLKMGKLALKILKVKPHFGLTAQVFTRPKPPYSCLADGVQLSTGATLGKANIKIVKSTKLGLKLTAGKKGVKLSLNPDYQRLVGETKEPEKLSLKLYFTPEPDLFTAEGQ